MVTVIQINNPLDIHRDMVWTSARAGQTIERWCIDNLGHGREGFPRPTLVQVNGHPVLYEYDPEFPDAMLFTYILREGDLLTLTVLPQGVETIIIAVVVAVVAVAVVLLMPEPVNPSQGTEGADPVYNLKGQTNRVRLGEPIEVHYGRTRVWPSYAAPPYNFYENNEQFMMSLFCWGQGYYDFGDNSEFYLEDTPVADFDEVEMQIIQPGGTVTLFPDYVVTSNEVSNIELYGPNEETYVAPGWEGPFVANAAGTTITEVQVDVVFPQGLYTLKKSKRAYRAVTLEVAVRAIDDLGDPLPLADWETVITQTVTAKSNTPQRRTFKATVDRGRYEVRARRTSDRGLNTRIVDMLQWEALRGFSGSVGQYGDVTLVALKARATNQLNNQTRARFNGYSTRKLATWTSGGGWGDRVATRNPIWAFCDVFRAVYGGKLPDSYLVMADLKALADTFDTREDWFDWTFDQPITVWEAAKAILRVGRAAPLPQGSRITAVRDVPQSLASAVFTPDNMVRDSLTNRLRMFQFNPFDSLSVEYTDPLTWKPLHVTCVLPGGTSNNPDTVKLIGCTQRAQAYREGMVLLARRMYQTETVVFRTGLEGHIPTYMDMVEVAHPDVDRGQGGAVLAYDSGTNVATLSCAVDLPEGHTSVILLRGSDGAAMEAPIVVTAVEGYDNKVQLARDPVSTLVFNSDANPPLFIVGVQAVRSFMGKVARVMPVDQDTVELELVTYDSRVYDYDDVPVPSLVAGSSPTNPGAPAVENVTITTLPDKDTTVIVTWKPAFGALRYYVEISYDDGDTWDKLGSTIETSWEIPVVYGDAKIRVSALGVAGRGGWAMSTVTTIGVTGSVPAVPTLNSSQVDFTGLTAQIDWQPAAGATGYEVEVYKSGAETPLRSEDVLTALTYGYTSAMMAADDATPSRDLDLKLVAYNSAGDSTPIVTRSVSNPKPATLTTPASSLVSGSTWALSWDAIGSPPADFAFYRVYASTSSGFTPEAANKVYEGSAATCNIDVTGVTYWKVAAFDVWASGHTDANFTAEQTITP